MANTTQDIPTVLSILDKEYPTIPMHVEHGGDPFRLLVAIILSQRARDSVTVPLTTTLFTHITTPQDMVDLPQQKLEDIIHPIGFYHAKATALQEMAKILVETYHGKVPTTEKELLALPHVGRKTANIILTSCFNTPQIAVDVHVHRITNRLGWVATTTPEQTERELTRSVPKEFHTLVNRVFVAHGQHVCLPRHPKCAACPIERYCKKVGVR